jgi:hypothetical protein
VAVWPASFFSIPFQRNNPAIFYPNLRGFQKGNFFVLAECNGFDENGMMDLSNTKPGFYALCVCDVQSIIRKTAIIKK